MNRSPIRALTVLDGAVGTELLMAGADMGSGLDGSDSYDDYWTGKAIYSAPGLVRCVHSKYVAAGADVITTNTFRLNCRVVEEMKAPLSFDVLARSAVSLAREAVMDGARARVGGSIGPVAIHTRPWDTPPPADTAMIHATTVRLLVESRVDLLLIETQSSIAEATLLAELASSAGIPFIVGFVIDERTGTLPSGEELERAAAALIVHEPEAVIVNHVRLNVAHAALAELGRALREAGIPYGVRPHIFSGECSPRLFIRIAADWRATGASYIGGCCGVGPEHIAALVAWRDGQRHSET